MTVGEIKTALKRYGFDDSDPLLIWINSAYHEIENAYQHWSFLEVDEEIETAERQFNLVGLVTRMMKLRDVTAELTTGGTGLDLTFRDRRRLERDFPNLFVQGEPEYFTIIGSSKLQVYPDPPAKRKYRASYIKELPDLVNDGDIPLIPVRNHFTIVRGAAYVGLQAENEEERAASAQAQFDSDLEKMILNDSNRQIGDTDQVEDTEFYATG